VKELPEEDRSSFEKTRSKNFKKAVGDGNRPFSDAVLE
jgi:hypothetical protein